MISGEDHQFHFSFSLLTLSPLISTHPLVIRLSNFRNAAAKSSLSLSSQRTGQSAEIASRRAQQGYRVEYHQPRHRRAFRSTACNHQRRDSTKKKVVPGDRVSREKPDTSDGRFGAVTDRKHTSIRRWWGGNTRRTTGRVRRWMRPRRWRMACKGG